MQVNGESYRTIRLKPGNPRIVQVIDQRFLPHQFVIEDIKTVEEMAHAIRDMHVRGAPLLGAAGAYGMYLAAQEIPSYAEAKNIFEKAAGVLIAQRPTAVNLAWGVRRAQKTVEHVKSLGEILEKVRRQAQLICDEDIAACQQIGAHGLTIFEELMRKKKGGVLNVLTHCNAGWLACIDWGTATAPIYTAFRKNLPIHVWVDETRPRNQGASLTAWELLQEGVPHTIIVDNAAGHLMQKGLVDVVITGTDRTTASGDVANKIGTYTKALAARDNQIPFYVAVPSSSIDWTIQDGLVEIPIEKRSADEVKYVQGSAHGKIHRVLVTPEKSPAENYAFDVTPRRLITGLITERGVSAASKDELAGLFPDKAINYSKV